MRERDIYPRSSKEKVFLDGFLASWSLPRTVFKMQNKVNMVRNKKKKNKKRRENFLFCMARTEKITGGREKGGTRACNLWLGKLVLLD